MGFLFVCLVLTVVFKGMIGAERVGEKEPLHSGLTAKQTMLQGEHRVPCVLKALLLAALAHRAHPSDMRW